MKTCLIIGGGPAGCAAAQLLTEMGGWEITLVEKAPFLGAGARTFFHGRHPYTFGPRHLLFHNEEHYDWLDRFLPLRLCNEHQFWTYVEPDAQFYNFPIHVDDIERMPDRDVIEAQLQRRQSPHGGPLPTNLEEYWIYSVGEALYRKFIDGYSRKMWSIPTKNIDTFNWSPKGVALKHGPRAAWDTALSAYPFAEDGYNSWFSIATAGAKVLLSTEITGYDFIDKVVVIDGQPHAFDIIVSTISPDIPFDYCYDPLPYVGRDFVKIVLPVEFALPKDVYWVYEAGKEIWTRLTEFKKLTRHQSGSTLLGLEIPSFNGKYYPIPTTSFQRRAAQYHQEMASGIYCLGRSGCYRYGIDIASCIEQAFGLVEVLKQGGGGHPVIGEKWRS